MRGYFTVDDMHSPCCYERLTGLTFSGCIADHFRCNGCRALYVMHSGNLTPCEDPENHSELSHVAALTPPIAPVRRPTLEKRGRGRISRARLLTLPSGPRTRTASPPKKQRR
jgi:hypothetical protein